MLSTESQPTFQKPPILSGPLDFVNFRTLCYFLQLFTYVQSAMPIKCILKVHFGPEYWHDKSESAGNKNRLKIVLSFFKLIGY